MLTVYLDTSDYSELYRDNLDNEMLSIRHRLLELSDQKKIRVCFSFLAFFELMQDFNPAQLEDRRKRIKFVQRLCENNNFPFFAHLLDGSNNQLEGPWIPSELTESLRGNKNSPELFFEHWFIKCKNKNPLKFVFQEAIKHIKPEIQMLQSCLKEIKAKEAEDKQKVTKIRTAEKALQKSQNPKSFTAKIKLPPKPDILSEINSMEIPANLQNFPQDVQKLFWEFFKGYIALNGERNFQDSDICDLMHALYIPHCDLWRGDRTFSNLLLNSTLDFKSKIVSSLRELPDRIETALNAM